MWPESVSFLTLSKFISPSELFLTGDVLLEETIKIKKMNTIEEQKHPVPVQQIRPDDSVESIEKPATPEEMDEAVIEINPDANSMNSRG